MKKILYIFCLIILVFLVSCKNTDKKNTLEKVKDYFSFPEVVTSDLSFPSEITIDEKNISLVWQASDDAISSSGVVTRDSVDKDVVIKVTAKLDDETIEIIVATVKVLKKENKYTINYNTNGGSVSGLVWEFEEGEEVTLPNPKKEGYSFIGWFEGNEKIEKIENRNYNLVARFEKNSTLLNVSIDEDILYVGTEALITIDGYSNLNLFVITSSDSSVAYVDEDYFLVCAKKGIATITFTLISDPLTKGEIAIEVLNKKPVLQKDSKPVVIGSSFSLKVGYYSDASLFDISYDNSFLSYEDGSFKALKEGSTTITYTLKSDSQTFASYDLTIYPVKPVLSISSNNVVVGHATRIDILNYDDINDVIIEVPADMASVNGRIITALKRGDIRVTVSLSSDSEISSYLDIHVLPVAPKIDLTRDEIIVGGITNIYFDNLEELDDSDINNYNIIISDESILSLSGLVLTGLKIGSTTVTIVNKNDEEIKEEVVINVIPNPSKYDTTKEICEGKLYITHKDNDDFDGSIHAGNMDYFEVFGALDSENYKWVSSDIRVITVFEDGRYIAIGKGSASVSATRIDNNEVVGRIHIKVYGEPDIDYVSRLIEIATSQLGYVEGPNNDTKYGTWYGLPNEEWCAMFVSWCANQAGISTDIIPRYAGCTAGKNWFEEHGCFKYKEEYTPKAGDIIFFLSDGAGHTGIVINCDGSRVYTIEGNTSDMCAKRSYSLNWHTITGYGTPNYPPFSGTTEGGDTSGSTEGGGHSTH
ncbi:MAG: CHAP domain-containing protein [Bacilli bacterium]|nr:CHAP domain-containing protein [Bacilli bacterium]